MSHELMNGPPYLAFICREHVDLLFLLTISLSDRERTISSADLVYGIYSNHWREEWSLLGDEVTSDGELDRCIKNKKYNCSHAQLKYSQD